jgi:hypothetical protein
MLIRLECGARVGDIVDMMPTEARAMLADGRATVPGSPVVMALAPSSVSVVEQQVAARATHVPYPGQHRRGGHRR